MKYAIVRHGSNSANQTFQNEAEIDIISARSAEAAVDEARQREAKGAYTLYANQKLAAVPLSSLPKGDRKILEEDRLIAQEVVSEPCLVCGRPVKTTRGEILNAFCGKCV